MPARRPGGARGVAAPACPLRGPYPVFIRSALRALRALRGLSVFVLVGLGGACTSERRGPGPRDAANGDSVDAALVDAALVDAALVDAALVDAALVDGALVDGADAGRNLGSGGSPGDATTLPPNELADAGGVAGGVPSDGGTPTDLGDLPETRCALQVTSAEISPEVATVGIVTFTTSLPALSRAEIQFGLDDAYGLVAPVDLSQPGNRTLLLGMIEDSTHHFRVVVSDGVSVCYGEDQTITTGSLGLAPLAEVSTSAAVSPGFIVTARDGQAVIYDARGRLVWAYAMWNVFSVQMSWDGRYMIGRDPGPFDSGDGGSFYRVGMDGSGFTTVDAPGGDHHDFTAIPGGIAYLGKTSAGECDSVYEASIELTDGAPIFDTWQIYQYFPDEGEVEGTELCHANRIHYLPERGAYSVSDRNKDALAFFATDGTPLTSIGKAPRGDWALHIQAEGAGPGGDWHVQHGHDLYADDKLVVFSNDSRGGAAVLHYTMGGDRARLDWKYQGAGPSRILGDVQALRTGNFLVTTNLGGTIVELAADGQSEVARYVLAGPTGPLYGFTYSRHRETLYGAPGD